MHVSARNALYIRCYCSPRLVVVGPRVPLLEATFPITMHFRKEAQVCYCGASNCRGYLGKAPSEDDDIIDDVVFEKLDSVSVTSEVEVDRKVGKKKRRKMEGYKDDTVGFPAEQCFILNRYFFSSAKR